jgi:hypothetical protein
MDNTLFSARRRLESLKKDRDIYLRMQSVLLSEYYQHFKHGQTTSFVELEELFHRKINNLHTSISNLENDIYTTEITTQLVAP